jgi:hypothetical protein
MLLVDCITEHKCQLNEKCFTDSIFELELLRKRDRIGLETHG